LQNTSLKIGLRGSELSLKQGELVSSSLEAIGCSIELVTIKTTGDKKQSQGEGVARDKCEWIREIEESIVAGQIDLGLHSGKDIPCELAKNTTLLSVLPREEPFDLLIGASSLDDLKQGALVGTASLRRKAQLFRARPDLNVKALRGNIGTRLSKLDSFDAIVLAKAGLNRLNLNLSPSSLLLAPKFIPSVNQGILACQFLEEREDVANTLKQISDDKTESSFKTERLVVEGLAADCSSSMGVYSDGSEILLQILSGLGEEEIFLKSEDPAYLVKEALSLGAKELLFPT